MTTPLVTPYGATAVLLRATDAAEARSDAAGLRILLDVLAASVVPGADSVVVNAAAGVSGAALLDAVNEALPHLDDLDADTPGRTVTIPVRYDGDDLSTVADLLGVSTDEVVARHTGGVYVVDFLGFAPGFPYLSGLDPMLGNVPRLDSPRTRVPAGSVGLAAGKTCVYPTASPGGWRLLGSTDMVLFDADNTDAPAVLSAGDTVRFTVSR
jgi:KipI family sensor histidine kinase inhibitor